MAKDFQAVRQEILAMHQRIQSENFYELLGVDQNADAALVGARFRDLARKWHVDRFSSYDLGAEKQKLQEIFSTLNTAQKTLSNPEERAEYDLTIASGPSIAQILEAESHFRRGKNMLASGGYKGAFEFFTQAHDLKDDEPEYRAYLLYTEYLLIPKDEEGHVKSRKRANEIFRELDELNEQMQEKDWLLTFLGTVAIGLKREREAEEMFSEALMMNKKNTNAKRQLRLLRSRRIKSQKSGGFLAKLFGK